MQFNFQKEIIIFLI